jgi:drug/metabolite transporter (DMT)-like permease
VETRADPPAPIPTSPRGRVIAAFATVYLVWGTTYFVVGQVVHALPPLIMTAGRFLLAGAILYGWRRAGGTPRPLTAHWLSAGAIGALMLLGGYGSTAWAQLQVPSGLTALLVSATPVVMVLLDWLRPAGTRPRVEDVAGLLMATLGMLLLLGPGRLGAAGDAPLLPVLVCVAGSFCWAAGSIWGRHVPQPGDVLLGVGQQMLCGSAWLLAAATVAGEWEILDVSRLGIEAIAGWLYLSLAGALAAYTAYVYLLHRCSAAQASTHNYVNPAIAVLVGWWLGGEAVTALMMLAGALILGGVAVIISSRGSR